MTMKTQLRTILVCLATLVAPTLRAADDILIADFEGTTYGNWKVTGEAFGPGPARGTLPGQMTVEGFKGKGLVNSFFKGRWHDGHAHLAGDHHRTGLHHVPHRWRRPPGQDVHEPARQWRGCPFRHRP
jgi:hypothetical protein